MTRARDVANVLSTATSLATDTETAAAISSHNTAGNGHVSRGNTASRPASPTVGDFYSNTETGVLEIYESTGWSPVIAPSSPTSVVATNQPSGRAYNNGQASVAFSAGTFPGTTYTITSSPGSYTASGSSSPITITGLQSSTQYTYTAVASSKYGTSAVSSSSTGVTATTVPQAPSISAALDTATTATITITAGATGGSAITQYSIISDPITTTQTTSSSPYTFTGLTTGTAYTFTATATNANGSSQASSVSNSITPVVPSSYESIATITVGAGGASSVTFSGIPQTYTHLQLRVWQKASSAGDLNFRFNNDSGANYSRHYFFGTGNIIDSGGSTSETQGYVGYNPSATYYQSAISDILDYTNTNKNKIVKSLLGTDTNSNTSYMLYTTCGWFQTSAITSISFTQGGGNTFDQYSQFDLYGIKV